MSGFRRKVIPLRIAAQPTSVTMTRHDESQIFERVQLQDQSQDS